MAGDSSSGKKTDVEAIKAQQKRLASTLWIEKFAPTALDELVINKKKVSEFCEIAELGGFLVLLGAPGSCKNALINAYCLQNDVKLLKHSDVKTQHLEELYGQRQTIGGFMRSAQYPDDLENLTAFIQKLANSAGNQRAKPTLSAFARGGKAG